MEIIMRQKNISQKTLRLLKTSFTIPENKLIL